MPHLNAAPIGVLSYRAFQRGDLLMAGVFLLVGVVLTVYRYRAAMRRAEQAPGVGS